MAETPAACPLREEALYTKLKRPLTADENGKDEVLRKLQDCIFFEKSLPPSSVGREYVLTLPSWFIEKHGDKLETSVILRSESSTKPWSVNLNLFVGNSTQVRFSGGWRAFARYHNLAAGDSLIFSLKAPSEFEVYMFHRARVNPTRFRRIRSRQCRIERVTGRVTAAAENFAGIAKEKIERDGPSVEAKGPIAASRNSPSSDSNKSHLQDNSQIPSQGGHGDALDNGSERAIDLDVNSRWVDPAQNICEAMKIDNGFGGQSDRVKTIRDSPLPRFSIKLTLSNFRQSPHRDKKIGAGFLEIPPGFWKAHSNRLHSFVTLQGIEENSPARVVACSLTSQYVPRGGSLVRYWRLYLRTGWRDFRDENKLKMGQKLEFTLSSDSFFVVRKVN